MKVEIVNALRLPWSEVRAILQDSSVAEVSNAESKLASFYHGSNNVWIGKVDGKPVCIYGLLDQSLITHSVYLWMLHTKSIEEHKFLFVRHSQQVIEKALEIYDVIFGHVDPNNTSGKRWLQWLGAKFEQPNNIGKDIGKMPFIIRKRYG